MVPQETPLPYVERSLWLEAVGHRIPAAVTMPPEGRPLGAVVIVPGSLYLDVDGNMPMFGAYPHAYADLARQLATRGCAALRYAKRGPQTGSEIVDAGAAATARTFRSRVEVLAAAAGELRALAPGIPVVLAGHSEGAVVVFLATSEGMDVEGVVSLSGPSVGIFDIMREQLPVPPGSSPEAYAAFDRIVDELRAGRPLPAFDATDPTLGSIAYIGQAGEVGIRYMVDVDAVDPVATASAVVQPMLIVQGGRDRSVPEHHADALYAGRKAAGRATRRAFFPELQHFYKRVAEDVDPMAAFMIDAESDPDVAAAIVRWLGEMVG
jgi:alpha-beta hydrolase superfamily lysophospholipase